MKKGSDVGRAASACQLIRRATTAGGSEGIPPGTSGSLAVDWGPALERVSPGVGRVAVRAVMVYAREMENLARWWSGRFAWSLCGAPGDRCATSVRPSRCGLVICPPAGDGRRAGVGPSSSAGLGPEGCAVMCPRPASPGDATGSPWGRRGSQAATTAPVLKRHLGAAR